jgi:hypothetical protein
VERAAGKRKGKAKSDPAMQTPSACLQLREKSEAGEQLKMDDFLTLYC